MGLTLYDLLLLNIHASFADKFIVGLLLVCFQVSGCSSHVCYMTFNNSVVTSLASTSVLLPQFLAKHVFLSNYITYAVTSVTYVLLLLLLWLVITVEVNLSVNYAEHCFTVVY
jgi:hypothetical protein